MDTMIIETGGLKVEMIDDDRICQHIKAGHGFEPDTLLHWDALCTVDKPIGWVIDVGAYSGLFSIMAALRSQQAVAVEPLMELQDRIHENAKLNGIRHHIIIIPAAAGDTTGEIGIGVNGKVHLTSGASVLRKSNQRIVPAWRIDDFEPGLLPIRLIKIDVEGYEDKVIMGALEMIKRHRPTMCVEVLTPEARQRVEDLLVPLGYVPARKLMDMRNLWLGYEGQGVLT